MAIKSRLDTKPEMSTAAFADFIFLLLIFFMVTSSFVNTPAAKLKYAIGEGAAIKKDHDKIVITEDGQYYWNNELVAENGDFETAEPILKEKITLIMEDQDSTNNVVDFHVDKSVDFGQAYTFINEVWRLGGVPLIRSKPR